MTVIRSFLHDDEKSDETLICRGLCLDGFRPPTDAADGNPLCLSLLLATKRPDASFIVRSFFLPVGLEEKKGMMSYNHASRSFA
jgi:hypothetical protein